MSYMYTTITQNQILGREVLESGGKPLQGKKFTVGEVLEEVGDAIAAVPPKVEGFVTEDVPDFIEELPAHLSWPENSTPWS